MKLKIFNLMKIPAFHDYFNDISSYHLKMETASIPPF